MIDAVYHYNEVGDDCFHLDLGTLHCCSMICALRAAPHSVLSVPGQFGMFCRKCYKLLKGILELRAALYNFCTGPVQNWRRKVHDLADNDLYGSHFDSCLKRSHGLRPVSVLGIDLPGMRCYIHVYWRHNVLFSCPSFCLLYTSPSPRD